MEQKLYLEITYGDNDWAETMNNVLAAVRYSLQQLRGSYVWSEDINKKDFDEISELLRAMITAQLNFEGFFRYGTKDYDYAKDTFSIKFDIVTEDKIKSWDNFETVYIQLFGSDRDYGDWFIV